jgi:hypothetical protein
LEELRHEIILMVCVSTRDLRLFAYLFEGKDIQSEVKQKLAYPLTIPNALLLTSGSLDHGNIYMIIKLLVGLDKLKGKSLRTWRKGESVQENELTSSLIIIHPNVCYSLPSDVAFLQQYCSPKFGCQ